MRKVYYNPIRRCYHYGMDKPETPLRQMLRDLTDWGYSQASIARAVYYHKPSICELLSGITRDLPYAVGVRIAALHSAELRRRKRGGPV